MSAPARAFVRATSIAIALASCTTGGVEPIADAPEGIVGGTPDAGDPAVLLVASYPADLTTLDTCSAVLLAPDVILTAAHCLDAVAHPGEKHGVFVGADASAYPTASTIAPKLIQITEIHLHPDYNRKAPFHADIAVAKLASPLSVPPLAIARVAPTGADVSKPARIVGFGETKYQQENLAKHAADTVLAAIDADDTVTVGDVMHKSCIGDSGGPAIMRVDGVETVIGIDSYTDLQGCLEPAHYRRTDVYASFIDTWAPPPPSASSATTTSTSSTSGGGATGGAGGGSSAASDGGCSAAPLGPSGEGWIAWVAFSALVAYRRAKGRALKSSRGPRGSLAPWGA